MFLLQHDIFDERALVSLVSEKRVYMAASVCTVCTRLHHRRNLYVNAVGSLTCLSPFCRISFERYLFVPVSKVPGNKNQATLQTTAN